MRGSYLSWSWMTTFVLHNTDKHKEQAAENRKGDNPNRALEFGGWL
jgi:hypothetical protein